MEVRLYPNSARPGVGLKPRRESQRPLLPLHSRHCPVLEAGSAVGMLVYPPLEEQESFHIGYQGEGRYRLVYYVNPTKRKWEPLFAVTVAFPAGGVGMFSEDVTFLTKTPATSRENALLMARTFMMPENLGTPPGGLSLRGAWNFQTPPGWDTVYTPIFNAIERPVAPMLVVRVETDWYPHETEFRYVLQAGESLSCERNLPIGQVVFVPREEVTLRDCDEAELAEIRESTSEFARQKASHTLTTSYGLQYSPHYLRTSRVQRDQAAHVGVEPETERATAVKVSAPTIQQSEPDGRAARRDTPVPKVGRNDPCPCGSGKKYKKCHGEHA